MFYKNHKKQEIVWKSREEAEKQDIIFSPVLEGGFTLTAAVLFLFCMKKCIMLLFPAQKFPVYFMIYSFYAVFPAVCFIALGKGLFMAYKKQIYTGVVLLYAGAVFFAAWKNRAHLFTCSINLFENYLTQVNVYYKVHMTVGGNPKVPDNRFGILFWGIVIYLFYLISGEILSKKYLLGMPPVFFLFLLLAVGKAPDYSFFSCLFSGIMILSFRGFYRLDEIRCRLLKDDTGKKSSYMRFVTFSAFFLLVIGLPVLSGIVFAKPAEKLMKYVSDAKEFQMELENNVEDFLVTDFNSGTETVDNKTPNYRHKEVLEVTVTGKAPRENQYFRDFFGMEYENGSWYTDEDIFTEKCERSGYSVRELSDFLAFPANSYFQKKKYGEKDFEASKIEQREVTLSYTGMRGGHVHLPYMLGEIKEMEHPEFEQDASLKKSRFQKKYQFSVWDPSYFEDTTLSSFLHYDEIEALYEQKDEKEREWQNWYDQYVKEHYLNAHSVEIPEILSIASGLKELLEFRWTGQDDTMIDIGVDSVSLSARKDFDDLDIFSDEIFDGDSEYEKIGVWQITDFVQSYLRQFQYSLQLNEISADTDPLEYFLSISHEGYCAHFASAGVLILRAMGIPARYATGYVVYPKDWQKNEDGSYTVKILDSSAHAWAEVYFEGIGWIPVEMTPNGGESIQVEENEENQDRKKSTSEKEKQKIENEPEQTEAPKETGAPATSAVPPTADHGNVDSGKNDFARIGFGNGGMDVSFVRGLFGILFGGAAVFFICLWLCGRKRKQSISEALRSNRNQAAVDRMNRVIYRRLCRKCHIIKRHMTDAEYEHLLRVTYPGEDWKEFMRIVKKASFSMDEVTEEEVAFCHRIYEKYFLGINGNG
ncbi:MAG: transglutaminase domain-containing protein [Lachnospiraceae bacterium]|nr:transglutaminase domain-containing protein [Lachnospiraceae bacterium]